MITSTNCFTTRVLSRALLVGVFLLLTSQVGQAQTYEIAPPEVVLTDVEFSVSILVEDDNIPITAYSVSSGGQTVPVTVDSDSGGWVADGLTASGSGDVHVSLSRMGVVVSTASSRALPGWMSILPPFIAILIALVFKRVVPALFVGLWLGAVLVVGLTPGALGTGFLDSFAIYVLGAFTKPANAQIILFSFMIGGMIGIISKNGGMQGIVDIIVGWATSPKRGQISTALLGLAIFFDDYANTLVVGNTMRPVTDKLRISREKLSYIVDSTAAPVACIALVTTWIGTEVGLIQASLDTMPGISGSAYELFISSIPYSFYPILAILFVFLVASTGRDFGPMYKAEVRARTTGEVLGPDANVDSAAAGGEELAPIEGKPRRWYNGAIPVAVMIGSLIWGLFETGSGNSVREIIGSADSYTALLWASLLGVAAAAVLSAVQRILTMGEIVEAWYGGLKGMMFAMIILILAWSLAETTTILHSADYLVSVLGDSLNPALVPAIVFILAAITAFSTGSSWGAMGILMPLVLPLVWAVMTANQMTDISHYHILYSTIACVLAGAVWGDHCSPISDTTILSSMASGADHMDHVRTQLPYALLVGSVGLVIGTIPVGFGLPWWIALLVDGALLYAFLLFVGKPVDVDSDMEPATA
jgi:Na+/H+ antiporter NhaC